MDLSQIGENYRNFFIIPGGSAIQARTEYLDSVQQLNPSRILDAKTRGLFLTQVICSIVALPLTLIAAIATVLVVSGFEGAKKGKEELITMAKYEIRLLASIPTCLIAAFARHSSEWISPTQEVREWLNGNVEKRERVKDELRDLDDLIEETSSDSIISDNDLDMIDIEEED
jgi:hypothetical protein